MPKFEFIARIFEINNVEAFLAKGKNSKLPTFFIEDAKKFKTYGEALSALQKENLQGDVILLLDEFEPLN